MDKEFGPYKQKNDNSKIFQISFVFLLAAILSVQVLLLIKLDKTALPKPITIGDYNSATPLERKEILNKLPIVKIHGTIDVNVDNTVDVNIENPVSLNTGETIDVNVANLFPIEVKIKQY